MYLHTHTRGTHTLTYGIQTGHTHVKSLFGKRLLSAFAFSTVCLALAPSLPRSLCFLASCYVCLQVERTPSWQLLLSVCLSDCLSVRWPTETVATVASLTHIEVLCSSQSTCPLSLSFYISLSDSLSPLSLAKRFTALRQLGQTHSGHDIVLTIIFRCQLRSFWWERVKINRG